MRIPLVCVLVCVGCAGGIHTRGEQQAHVQLSWADPFRDHPVWGIGQGTAENRGVAAGYGYWFADRWAVLASFTPWRVFDQAGEDVRATEFQLGFRAFALEFHTGKAPTALYFEVLGGRMWADDAVPPAGTKDNWTQDFGAGLEWRISGRMGLLLGYRLRHLSNGKGSGSDNPSQNENVVLGALTFTW